MAVDLGIYEKAMPESFSFADKLKTAEAAGFDYLEISIDESDKKLSRLRLTCRGKFFPPGPSFVTAPPGCST